MTSERWHAFNDALTTYLELTNAGGGLAKFRADPRYASAVADFDQGAATAAGDLDALLAARVDMRANGFTLEEVDSVMMGLMVLVDPPMVGGMLVSMLRRHAPVPAT